MARNVPQNTKNTIFELSKKTCLMLKFLLTLFILLILASGISSAQGIRTSADGIALTQYVIGNESDTIYTFDSLNPDQYIEVFTDGDPATIVWEYFDTLSYSYVNLSTVTGVTDRLNVNQNGGYKVTVSTGGGDDFVCRFWVFIVELSVEIYNGNINSDNIKEVPQEHKWCHLIRDIRARSPEIVFNYFHPEIDTMPTYTLVGEYEVDWSSNPVPEEPGINYFVQNDNFSFEIDIQDPYWEDSWYIITVNCLGAERKDSIFYESIEPHADYDFEYITLDNRAYYPDRSDLYYENFYNSSTYDYQSAPAMFVLRNHSVNTDNMLWIYGDGNSEPSTSDSVLHTYTLPGIYSPRLVAHNEIEHLYETCTDTFPKYDETDILDKYPLEIGQSALSLHASDDGEQSVSKMPNVFTCPGGDNNYFRFENDVSITFFEIVIYNRYGKRVYHYEGNIRDWDGWDGRDNNSSKYVSTGVYFYVVREIRNLPDYNTGLRSRIQVYTNDAQQEQQASSSEGGIFDMDLVNSLYKGFVHVYNTE